MCRISAHDARSPRYCDGISRRNFVQLGMAGLVNLHT